MNEAEGVTPKRASGFLSLPSTGVGKWSARLLVVSLVLILLNNLVVMPETEQQTSLELAQRAFNLAVFLCVAFAGVTGLFAIVMKRERSWAVFVAVLLFIVAVGFNLAPSTLPFWWIGTATAPGRPEGQRSSAWIIGLPGVQGYPICSPVAAWARF